jgi:hypothetical protein
MKRDKKLICYVDDDRDEIERFRKNMSRRYEIAAGVSFEEAVSALSGRRPDLFLLDLYFGNKTTPLQRQKILRADRRVTKAEIAIRKLMSEVDQQPEGGYRLAHDVAENYKGIPRAFFSRKAFLEDALRAFEMDVPLLEKPDPDPNIPTDGYDTAFRRGADQVARQIDRLIPPTSLVVFISHSAADAAIAEKLIDLIERAVEISPRLIRCTSVDGYKLPQECCVVVGLLTKSSLNSPYVLMELGAAWGFNKTAILLLDDVTSDALPGPFKEVNALRLNHRPDLEAFVDAIANNSGLKRIVKEASYAAAVDDLVTVRVERRRTGRTRRRR